MGGLRVGMLLDSARAEVVEMWVDILEREEVEWDFWEGGIVAVAVEKPFLLEGALVRVISMLRSRCRE